MRYIVSGGGTGGHIYPALAIIDKIKKEDKEAEILYIGTSNGLESELVPKAGIAFEPVRVKGLPRKINKDFFVSIKELVIGFNQAKKIIKAFKPDVVIGTGGYVSAPVLYKASRMKIPTLIHEQNAYPGITNKILARLVDTVAISFLDSKKRFTKAKNIVLTGIPLRQEFMEEDFKVDRLSLGLEEDLPLVLSFGGSGGQNKLNKAMVDLIKEASLKKDLQLIVVTGKRFYDTYLEELERENIDLGPGILIRPYIHNMPQVLNLADLVITSSGAITLAEISALGKPSILIPKSYTAENHQEYNARTFEDQGAGEMILEKDLQVENIKDRVYKLIVDKNRLEDMSRKSKKLSNKDAASLIYNEIQKILR